MTVGFLLSMFWDLFYRMLLVAFCFIYFLRFVRRADVLRNNIEVLSQLDLARDPRHHGVSIIQNCDGPLDRLWHGFL